MRKVDDGKKKKKEKKEKRIMFLVATTSLLAVYRPNDDRWNAARSCQKYGFTENITYLMDDLQRHEVEKYCIDTKQTFFGCSLDGDSAFEVVCQAIQKRELYFPCEIGQLAILHIQPQ